MIGGVCVICSGLSEQQKYSEFYQHMRPALPKWTVLQNPGGGTSEVLGYTSAQVVYKRGSSKIYVSISDLFRAYQHFRGTRVSGPDLRQYAPSVFDSKRNGHSCNCTFLFMTLYRMGLCSEIRGLGRRGNPFYVHMY